MTRTREVGVMIPPDLSSTERWKGRTCQIDWCIADIVEALQAQGIMMRGSCCGHGRGNGDIHLQDGRLLLILAPDEADYYLANR